MASKNGGGDEPPKGHDEKTIQKILKEGEKGNKSDFRKYIKEQEAEKAKLPKEEKQPEKREETFKAYLDRRKEEGRGVRDVPKEIIDKGSRGKDEKDTFQKHVEKEREKDE